MYGGGYGPGSWGRAAQLIPRSVLVDGLEFEEDDRRSRRRPPLSRPEIL